jgi:hypothetical protein
MQKEEERSSTMDPWSIFLCGMKAPMTREKYRGRLVKFFDFIGMTGGTIEEGAKTFTERGKKEPDWVFVSVLRFAQIPLIAEIGAAIAGLIAFITLKKFR